MEELKKYLESKNYETSDIKEIISLLLELSENKKVNFISYIKDSWYIIDANILKKILYLVKNTRFNIVTKFDYCFYEYLYDKFSEEDISRIIDEYIKIEDIYLREEACNYISSNILIDLDEIKEIFKVIQKVRNINDFSAYEYFKLYNFLIKNNFSKEEIDDIYFDINDKIRIYLIQCIVGKKITNKEYIDILLKMPVVQSINYHNKEICVDFYIFLYENSFNKLDIEELLEKFLGINEFDFVIQKEVINYIKKYKMFDKDSMLNLFEYASDFIEGDFEYCYNQFLLFKSFSMKINISDKEQKKLLNQFQSLIDDIKTICLEYIKEKQITSKEEIEDLIATGKKINNDECFRFYCYLKMKNVEKNKINKLLTQISLIEYSIRLSFNEYIQENQIISEEEIKELIKISQKMRNKEDFKFFKYLKEKGFEKGKIEKLLEQFILVNYNLKSSFFKYIQENQIMDEKEIKELIIIFKKIRDEKCVEFIKYLKKLKIENKEIEKYLKDFLLLETEIAKKECLKYINENDIRSKEEIEKLMKLIKIIKYSNASELRNFKDQIIVSLLKKNNPIENFKKIESIFLKNNLPTVGKVYSIFQILYPRLKGFNLSSKQMSPVLRDSSTMSREIIIFSDLLRAALGSNNRSLKSYIRNIEEGYKIFVKVNNNLEIYDGLSNDEKEILKIFISHLNTLYSNTLEGKNLTKTLILSDNILEDAQILANLFSDNGKIKEDLPDRIIRMFCHFAGFDSLEEIKKYMESKVKAANEKGIVNESRKLVLEKGDFIKGLGSRDSSNEDILKYLINILQNGSVAKEFLGPDSGSDLTPLDTDLSMILEKKGNLSQTMSSTKAAKYGPIWIVLKNDRRFNITRNDVNSPELLFDSQDFRKLEAFVTLDNEHYGIRTGFASSEIDYIICGYYDPRIGLELAMNGFYIPIVDKNTEEVVFTYKDYQNIRKRMMGLKYYDEFDYIISKNAKTKEVEKIMGEINENERNTNEIREKLYSLLDKSLVIFSKEENIEPRITLKKIVDGDLTDGSIEVLDTGSTGRKTNLPGDGDFDFMIKVDQNLILDNNKMLRLKKIIVKLLNPDANINDYLEKGDIRELSAKIDGVEIPIKVDMSFVVKSDKSIMNYPTEECVKDRLETIKKQYGEEGYNAVISNVIMAKNLLKAANAYKPSRKDENQGGMGGIGIETWILQNGGSLYDATISFLKVANDCKNFEEFKEIYRIWDFGNNHLTDKKGIYPHGNFINNMNSSGYEKMKKALNIFVKNYENEQTRDEALQLTIMEFKGNKEIEAYQKYCINRGCGYKIEEEAQIKEDVTKLLKAAGIDGEIKEANMGQTGFMFEVNKNGKTYIIKPGVNKTVNNGEYRIRPARSEIQSAASKVQQILSPQTSVEVTTIGYGNVRLTIQPKIPTTKCNDIIAEHASELLGEYVVDYIIGNFDADANNFIVDTNNILKGIDKEQGLKYLMLDSSEESLKLDMSYNPGGTRGAIYVELFRRIKAGEMNLEKIDKSNLYYAMESLKTLDVRDIFKKYAEAYDASKVEEILNRIEKRKEYFLKNITEFLNILEEENKLNISSIPR